MRESFRSIPDRFGAIVARLPDATAIIGEGVSFTYRQLDLLSDRLADGLMSWGVKPGEPVVLVLPRSPAAVIAMLAALKAGAYYVPLDPSAPDQVLADYLSELQVSCVVVPHGCVRHFAAGLQVHAIGPDGAPGAVEVVRPRLSKQYAGKASLESPAYAMFTSGSTGKPKGVLIPHRAVLRLVVEPDYIKISCEDRVLHAAPITFDASTFEIWAPLLNGAVLVVYESGVLDLNAMQELASTAGVTVMWLTAALFHLVVRSFMSLLTGVRVLLAGGMCCAQTPWPKSSQSFPASQSSTDTARQKTPHSPVATSCGQPTLLRKACLSAGQSGVRPLTSWIRTDAASRPEPSANSMQVAWVWRWVI